MPLHRKGSALLQHEDKLEPFQNCDISTNCNEHILKDLHSNATYSKYLSVKKVSNPRTPGDHKAAKTKPAIPFILLPASNQYMAHYIIPYTRKFCFFGSKEIKRYTANTSFTALKASQVRSCSSSVHVLKLSLL